MKQTEVNYREEIANLIKNLNDLSDILLENLDSKEVIHRERCLAKSEGFKYTIFRLTRIIHR